MVRIYKPALPDINIPEMSTYDLLFTTNKRFDPAFELYVDAESGVVRTMGEFKLRIDKLANGIHHNLGSILRPGNVACIFSTNHLEYPVLVHALIRCKIVATLANPTYQPHELAHQLKDSGAKVIFCLEDTLPSALVAAEEVGIPANRIFLIHAPHEKRCPNLARSHKSVLDLLSDKPAPADFFRYTIDDIKRRPSYLCYSSGTTGKAKGVMTSQYNIVANTLQLYTTHVAHGDLRPDACFAGVLPMFHIYGLQYLLHVCLLFKAKVVIFKRFNIDAFMRAIHEHKMTFAVAVPPIVLAMVKYNNDKGYDLSSLELINSGAAPLGGELAQQAAEKYKCIVMQGYGLTESSPTTHMSWKLDNDTASIGRLVPNMEARIVDPETGLDSDRGELWLRGPNVMLGYLNNPEATRNTIDSDGFLHTGDVAIIRDGKYYIVDRIKELIKYKGFQVAPAELEAHLQAHPEISDAAVIGHPNAEAGELPRAYVVLRPKSRITPREIRDYLDARVGATKRLRGGVVITNEIPKSVSGKILRRFLRDADKNLHYLDNGSMYDSPNAKL